MMVALPLALAAASSCAAASARASELFVNIHCGQAVPALRARNVTPQQMLQGLVKAGAKVEVCALCLPNTGHQPGDPIDGVTPARPADVAAHLLKPGVRTLGF